MTYILCLITTYGGKKNPDVATNDYFTLKSFTGRDTASLVEVTSALEGK